MTPRTTDGDSPVSRAVREDGQIFLDRQGLARALSITTTMVARLVRQDDFPKPRAIVGARVGWLLREVVEWCEARPASVVKCKTTGGKS